MQLCRGPCRKVVTRGRGTALFEKFSGFHGLLLGLAMSEVVSLSKVQQLRRLNKSELAEFFGVSVQAVDAWCRRGCPVVRRASPGKPWVFDALDVARWKYETNGAEGGIDPDDMTPQDRKAWYDSETRRRDLQIKDRELIPTPEVEQAVATAFAAISQGLLSLPDNIERRTGCSPEIVEAVEQVLHSEMVSLADRLQDLAPVEVEHG